MRARLVAAVLALLAAPAAAEEGGTALRAKALASAAGERPAPAGPDPYAELFKPPPTLAAPGGSACEARDLCYDPGERRLVYRPARGYMPGVQGLQAESISLRRDRIILKYSFR